MFKCTMIFTQDNEHVILLYSKWLHYLRISLYKNRSTAWRL